MHHVVIIVVITIIAVLTLYYSIMSHATLMLIYQESILTLQNYLISHALQMPQVRYYRVRV